MEGGNAFWALAIAAPTGMACAKPGSSWKGCLKGHIKQAFFAESKATFQPRASGSRTFTSPRHISRMFSGWNRAGGKQDGRGARQQTDSALVRFSRRTQVQDREHGRQNTLLPGGISVESGKRCIRRFDSGPLMLEELASQSPALTNSCFPSTPRSGALGVAPLARPAGGRAAGGRQPSSGWSSPWPCAERPLPRHFLLRFLVDLPEGVRRSRII